MTHFGQLGSRRCYSVLKLSTRTNSFFSTGLEKLHTLLHLLIESGSPEMCRSDSLGVFGELTDRGRQSSVLSSLQSCSAGQTGRVGLCIVMQILVMNVNVSVFSLTQHSGGDCGVLIHITVDSLYIIGLFQILKIIH